MEQGWSVKPCDEEWIGCNSTVLADLCDELLRAGVSVRFRARGSSMLPLVRDGDAVLVRPVAAEALRVGDVLLFRGEAGQAIVHRVIGIGGDQRGLRFLMQGDRMARPDGQFSEAQVLGRVAAIDRQGMRIEVGSPLFRLLGWVAVLRSRGSVGRGGLFRLAARVGRKLPVVSRYLA